MEPLESVARAVRHDVDLVQGPNNTFYYGTREDRLYFAVVKEAPYKIQIVEPKVPLVQSGTMDLKIAAIAISHNALLLSRNLLDFQKVPGLRVEKWLD